MKKLIRPTHTIGVTSTPPTNGMTLRVAFKTGSVGAYAMTQGNFVPSMDGYHVIGMRIMYKNVNTLNNGRRNVSRLCAVVASISAMLDNSCAPVACAAPAVASRDITVTIVEGCSVRCSAARGLAGVCVCWAICGELLWRLLAHWPRLSRGPVVALALLRRLCVCERSEWL